MGQIRIDVPVEQIEEFCRRWQIVEFSIFGSALREDFCPESDVDVLVSFDPEAQWGLFDWARMAEELEEIFSRKVDLVSKRGLRNPYRRREILKNRDIIYAA
jgi:predicted nucleotidyltransferase